jgi:hypothetical protein
MVLFIGISLLESGFVLGLSDCDTGADSGIEPRSIKAGFRVRRIVSRANASLM